MGKAIEIFTVGRHIASAGQPFDFSEADMAKTVAAYDPSKHEAPLVVGHPKGDAPAFGWVKGLAANDGSLFADTDQVNADFAEQVRTGAYKKVSASFYLPDSKSNPVPGVHYLRHVGFLGAQPPAVKGLAPVEFGDDGADCISVEFGDMDDSRLVRTGRILAELLGIKSPGLSWVDFTDLDITPVSKKRKVGMSMISQPEETKPEPDKPAGEKLEEEEVNLKKKPDPKPGTDAGTEGNGGTAQTPEEMEARLEALEKQNADFQERAAKAECRGIVDKAVAAGRLTGAQADGLVEFMAGLDESGTVEFGEGDDAVKTNPRKFMAEFLGRLPKQVDFSERSADDGGPDGMTPEEVADKAVAFREAQRQAGNDITITKAVAAVKEGKDA